MQIYTLFCEADMEQTPTGANNN